MATRKKAETTSDLYNEVMAEIEGESRERKKAILKERVKEFRVAKRVYEQLEAQLEELIAKPLDEFDD